jgi:hypothetical protein
MRAIIVAPLSIRPAPRLRTLQPCASRALWSYRYRDLSAATLGKRSRKRASVPKYRVPSRPSSVDELASELEDLSFADGPLGDLGAPEITGANPGVVPWGEAARAPQYFVKGDAPGRACRSGFQHSHFLGGLFNAQTRSEGRPGGVWIGASNDVL